MMSNILLEQAEFADNPEPRCPVVLLLDTSGSMKGEPIDQLNEGLRAFDQALKGDHLAALRVEVAIVTFGGRVHAIDVRSGAAQPVQFDANQAFVTVDGFRPPILAAGGPTPMGEAVRRSLTLLRERKDIYKQNGLDYYRPWMFLITDGQPTDEWQQAAQQVREEEDRKGVSFYGIGTTDAVMATLAQFTPFDRPPFQLKELAFGELFQWLSKSLSVVAHSTPGVQVPLPDLSWATFGSDLIPDTSRFE
ncbi:MAG: VWA domain-containing protein [Chloroflexi bacterium]|nr:VWA domain-containing protein [Chloroflexota bacterium]